MAYCRNCGQEIHDLAVICPSCGVPVENAKAVTNGTDNGGFGWGLLGFFVPIAGLILYLIWKDEKPRTAKAAGKGALAYVIFGAALFVVYIIVFAVLMGTYGWQ